ncbi:hypothetical protein [Actinomyces ruminis]|uniref:Uncharacterized protein n=1 Tax=Actinomyces ruminis TaxID=1937003 RepID=A0ABX4MBC1_9ACTO|nr:hypothetical protein [Actinomyces ruminis]PHP52780.1 hypothetical protein BW737_008030 [Actinomyces ruminis]
MALLAWAYYAHLIRALPRDHRLRAATLLVLLLTVIPAFVVAGLFGRLWLRQSGAIGMDYPALFPLTVTAAGIALMVAADVPLRLLRRRRPADHQPSGAACAPRRRRWPPRFSPLPSQPRCSCSRGFPSRIAPDPYG